MIFSLIICTYKRPKPIISLLDSVVLQTVYPNQILIVDGSIDNETADVINSSTYDNLIYYKVPPEHRGLTRQRNYGIERIITSTEVVCFLDDDTILESNYFEELIKTYRLFPKALGVGGYINNEIQWEKAEANFVSTNKEFYFDGWFRKDGSRFVLRKKLGLDSNRPPGFLPDFSHGRSIGFLPPSGKIYQVEQLMGGVSSFRKNVFENLKFSTYFEGYGLYEDADFTLRLSKLGELYINTNAKLAHYHDASGRPNKFQYGKMVVRNGWYVWRVKYPNPSFKAQLKWHTITLLLTGIRISNAITSSQKREAATESIGRIVGWLSLLLNKPKML
jgi:GT2 family glycosyltransferase